MKKLLALILVLVMCLPLCACGEGNETDGTTANSSTTANVSNDAIIGAWRNDSNNVYFITEDGNFIDYYGNQNFWWYDSEAKQYFYSNASGGVVSALVIQEDEQGRFFTLSVGNGSIVTSVSEYQDGNFYYIESNDREAGRKEFFLERFKNNYTELIVGKTYNTEYRGDFTVKALADAKAGRLELTFSGLSEDFNLMSAYYVSATTEWHKVTVTSVKEEGAITYSFTVNEDADFEKDKENYGFLCFSIDNNSYYISIDAFFE